MCDMVNQEVVKERFDLAMGRIREITQDKETAPAFRDYFVRMAAFIERMEKEYRFVASGALYEAALLELQKNNRELYADILPENYETSYANPAFAVSKLGEDYGQLLSLLYVELRTLIVYAYEQDLFEMTIRMELFLEVYGAFLQEKEVPDCEVLKQIVSSFVRDYLAHETEKRIKERLLPEEGMVRGILMEQDLSDLRYLFYFGEYVTREELKAAAHMNELSEEKIALIADTFTEGFCRGFEVYKKDMSNKETVQVMYCLGFDRVIRQAALNFEKMGLKAILRRADFSIFHGGGIMKRGVYGAIANKQCDFDHKDDRALFMDKNFNSRMLEAAKNALEKWKADAQLYAGLALFEPFGETPFAPVNKKEALELSQRQQKLSVEYMSSYAQMQDEYIPNEETSFTIISFPVPAIGDRYEEIFDAIVDINTLDNSLYLRIQQTIIDTLDQAQYVRIKGMNKNKTDLTVSLRKLNDPSKETIFENCVADVNIPAGEVFTSPVLKGTNGCLHVTRVFLKELEFKNLTLTFKDGMVTDYSCDNFETEEENRKYIKDHVLFHHETLPMGEFAIGTNTVAYVMSEKYGIGDLLPILIAEKMGPHFAVGDTCYSQEEELSICNPDGKEIIAKDNEISILRKTDMSKAYFNCHTDITIPYGELGELSAVLGDSRAVTVIENGRFVLKGCEELNKPFLES